MYAVTIPEPGGPDALAWAEVEDPVPGPGELLLDVVASAVNRADLLQRQGHYPPPAGAPAYPGLEASGRVAALGPGVTGWEVGEEACALLAGGGYAEKVAVPAGQVLPLPRRVDLVSAAGLPETLCTVWSNLVMRAALAPGEWLLVHGGAGGIGTAAIQIGVALGARVVATAGSERKLALCRELGAEAAVSYREDWVAAVREATGGHGADVVLDPIGAKYLAPNVDVLAADGRLVVIGMQGGTRGQLDLGGLMAKRGALHVTAQIGRAHV